MRAAVFHAPNDALTVEEIDIDDPRGEKVVVRTAASGVCHSDLHFVEGKYAIPMPAILGHEAAGTVEAVGDQVTYVKPGDTVITCLSVFCGHCEFCLRGQPVLCTRTDVVRGRDEPPRLYQGDTAITQMAQLSSYAEQMLVHEHALVKVLYSVPLDGGGQVVDLCHFLHEDSFSIRHSSGAAYNLNRGSRRIGSPCFNEFLTRNSD